MPSSHFSRDCRVLAVVLNWNGARYLRTCLDHLARQQGVSLTTVVIDNGSTDGSWTAAQEFPCSLIRLASNVGFSAGMNVGLEQAVRESYDFVWLVNNDAFPEADCLQSLVTTLIEGPDLAIVTPRLIGPTGREQHAGGHVDLRDGTLTPLQSAELATQEGQNRWLTGTALLIRTAFLERAGYLEPAYFAYWEDVELSVRAQRKGWQVTAVPEATVTHVGSASSGRGSPLVEYLQTRNAWLFLRQHGNQESPLAAKWLRYVARTLRRVELMERFHGNPEAARAVLCGLSAARRRETGPPPHRYRPRVPERIASRWPWRVGSVLNGTAAMIERYS